MTRIPKNPPPPVEPLKDDSLYTEIRHYKVITPMYGGGVEPGNADPISVVRATEIRGHLRFWWRATRGGDPKFGGKLDKMKTAEDKIWGSSGDKEKPGPSKVTISILSSKKGNLITKDGNRDYGDPRSKYGYVAFPLRDSHGAVLDGVEFSIQITYKPNNDENLIVLKKEVRAALWAWETFGGIGARTRRGFGAIQCLSVDNQTVTTPLSHDVEKRIHGKLEQHRGNWPKGVPHLSSDPKHYLVTSQKNDIDLAWRILFRALKDFRQDRKDDSHGKPFGRSKWPEPDEVRRKVARPGYRGYSQGHNPVHPVHKFPRAQFGLPIIFKFRELDESHGDPKPTTLQGENHDRLASPLILRPLACAGGKAVGLATILQWETVDSEEPYTPPEGLVLKDAPGNPKVQSVLDTSEVKKIPILKGHPDVLQAFLEYLKLKGK